MDSYIFNKLQNIKNEKLYRCEKNIDKLNIKINLSSNDYLSMSKNPVLFNEAINAINLYGVGSPSSRLVSGNLSIHKNLEKTITSLKETEDTIVVGSGYIANLGVLSSLCSKDFIIFSDKINHASIVDGAILSRAKLVRYKHCDTNDLIEKITQYSNYRKVIITDSVFSMDGDVAPLEALSEISKKYNALLIVDDAHGFGVLGKNGSGALEHLRLKNENIIQIGTLSKAVGNYGGFITGKKLYIDYFRNFLRGFIYSTALPPSVILSSEKSIEIISTMKNDREILRENSIYLRTKLKNMKLETVEGETPIIPIILKGEEKVLDISKKLLEKGIYVPAIRKPTVPKGLERIRVSLNTNISKKDIDIFLNNLKELI